MNTSNKTTQPNNMQANNRQPRHTQSNKWVLASNNQGKLSEFQDLFNLNDMGIELIAQARLNIKDAIEDGLTFVENAIIKARHVSKISGLPAIADDSGLCVPLLGNAPGIYSARYAGESDKLKKDNANNTKLIHELEPFRIKEPEVPIIGQFVCVLAMVRHAEDPLPLITQGIWQGEILSEPKGENGFGYDPLFWLPEFGKTSAQLSKSEKSKMSHRGIASRQLVKLIAKEW